MNKKPDPIEQQVVEVAKGLVLELPGLLKEFIRAGISNPIIGVASTIAIGNMLKRAGFIDNEAYIGILVGVGVLEGANVAEGVIKAFNPFSSQGSNLEPSATTVVFGGDGQKEIAGLIESLKGGK